MWARVRHVAVPMWLGLLSTMVVPGIGTVQAQRTGSATTARSTSPTRVDAKSAVATAFRGALSQATVQSAVKAELVRQVRTRRPVAIVSGAWVTPIDLSLVYRLPGVRNAMLTTLGGNGTSLIDAAIADPAGRLGLAYSEAELGRLLMGDMARDITASFAPGALATKMTELGFVGGVALGAGMGIAIVVGVYAGTSTGVGEWLTGALFGSGEATADTGWDPDSYDPNADPDGDGKANYIDDDDDGDGVKDEDDAYPDDKDKSICDCNGPDAIFFTSRFSDQMTSLVLSTTNVLKARGATVVSLGAAAPGQPGTVGVVF